MDGASPDAAPFCTVSWLAKLFFFTPGAVTDVVAAWRERLGDEVVVATRAEAVAAGWFGSVVEDRVAPRIGDVVATMTGPVAVVDSRRHRPELIALLGLHGSLTVDEVAIPWLTLPAERA